jgi:hypothetical protein
MYQNLENRETKDGWHKIIKTEEQLNDVLKHMPAYFKYTLIALNPLLQADRVIQILKDNNKAEDEIPRIIDRQFLPIDVPNA